MGENWRVNYPHCGEEVTWQAVALGAIRFVYILYKSVGSVTRWPHYNPPAPALHSVFELCGVIGKVGAIRVASLQPGPVTTPAAVRCGRGLSLAFCSSCRTCYVCKSTQAVPLQTCLPSTCLEQASHLSLAVQRAQRWRVDQAKPWFLWILLMPLCWVDAQQSIWWQKVLILKQRRK